MDYVWVLLHHTVQFKKYILEKMLFDFRKNITFIWKSTNSIKKAKV